MTFLACVKCRVSVFLISSLFKYIIFVVDQNVTCFKKFDFIESRVLFLGLGQADIDPDDIFDLTCSYGTSVLLQYSNYCFLINSWVSILPFSSPELSLESGPIRQMLFLEFIDLLLNI